MDRKRLLLMLLCATGLWLVSYGQETSSNAAYGIVLSPNLELDDSALSTDGSGSRVEAGAYLLGSLNEKLSISIDLRLSYAQGTRSYVNLQDSDFFFSRDSTALQRNAELEYEQLAITFPVSLRYRPFRNVSAYLMLGFTPVLNLSNTIQWTYDEFEYNRNTMVTTLRLTDQMEELEEERWEAPMHIGIGYQMGRWMLEAQIRFGYMDIIESDFLGGISYRTVGLHAYYRLNE
jgi:hypothetical protein